MSMNKQQIEELIDAKVAGQGSAIDVGGALPTIMKETLNLIPEGGEQVQADWTESDAESPAFIKNKPTIPAAQVNADWNAESGVAAILNKPNFGVIEVNCRLDNPGSKLLKLDIGETATIPELIQAWKAGKTIRCKFEVDGYPGIYMYVDMTCYNEGSEADAIDESLSGYGGCFEDSQSEGIVLGQYFLAKLSE